LTLSPSLSSSFFFLFHRPQGVQCTLNFDQNKETIFSIKIILAFFCWDPGWGSVTDRTTSILWIALR